jgi:uncharacterized protein DUF3800
MWDVMQQLAKVRAAQGKLDYRPHLGKRPVFADDKLFLPLQAADLYAWLVRRALSANGLRPAQRNLMRDLEAVSAITRHVDERRLKSFRNHIETGAAVFATQYPNIELLGYQGTEAQRRAARIAARTATKGKRDHSGG